MSGPATASFAFAPLGALSLAALALREARQMGLEYQDVLRGMQARAAQLSQLQQQAYQARFEHILAQRLHAQQLQAKLTQLHQLAQTLGLGEQEMNMPVALAPQPDPTSEDEGAWQLHLQGLSDAIDHLHANINAARHNTAAAAHALLAVGDAPPVEDALHAYLMQRALHSRLDPAQTQSIGASIARILERVDLDAGEPLPQDLAALGQEMALAPTLERCEALGVELRLRVQKQREDKATQRADRAAAIELLQDMGDEAPLPLRQLLQAVACGAQPLLPATLALAQQARQQMDAQRQHSEQEAAAQILEQSLQDLGYTVDGVEDTLFVDGGVAHFQRHGWGEYFVRLRVAAADKTVNFNVVRARGAQDSAERRRLDYLAEDRWCSEFPKLLETLAARGIQLNVTRLLGAGELPVQAVDAASLPQILEDNAQRSTDQLQAMKRPK